MLTFSAKVYVFFPGGFGTLDEFSEILELRHTAKIPPVPIFLFGSEFWSGLDAWFAGKMSEWQLIETGAAGEAREMVGDGAANSRNGVANGALRETAAADENIVKNARELYKITDNVDEIVAVTNQVESRDVSAVINDIARRPDVVREGKFF